MPASPDMAYDLARQIAVLYEDAELALLEKLQRALTEGIDSPRWAELKLASIGNLRAAVEEVSRALMTDADGAIGRAVAEAYDRGGQAAVAELGALPEGLRHAAQRALPNASRVDRLAASAVRDTRPVYARITRAVTDAYRTVINKAGGSVLLGGLTRRQASQRALDQFATRGITSFTDTAGRNWEMASYAEMAVRTITGRAAIEGHTDSLEQLGQGLVIVSNAPLECPLCAPWEGEILTISGPGGPQALRMEDMSAERRLFQAPQTVPVHVAGSLLEARAAGLFHPNCRHSISAYLPGVTTRPESPPHPQGATYEDTQQQRYLERQVRAWKRRGAVAMDEQARRKANAKVREYQARLRQLTAETGLRRKSQREQIGAAR
jgi:hypothetical protein